LIRREPYMGDLNDTSVANEKSLVQMPLSELTATLEILDNFGVEPEDLRQVRRDRDLAHRVAHVMTSPVNMKKVYADGRSARIIYSDSVEIDYRQTALESLSESGVRCSDDDQQNLSEHLRWGFPVMLLYMVKLKGDFSYVESLQALDDLGLQPAEYMQGLAFLKHIKEGGGRAFRDIRLPAFSFRIGRSPVKYAWRLRMSDLPAFNCHILEPYEIDPRILSGTHILAVAEQP
jgi:hypothetical protein